MDPTWIEFLSKWRGVLSIGWMIVLLAWESLHPCFKRSILDWRSRGHHGLLNIGLGFVNAVVTTLVFVALWKWSTHWAQENSFGLLNWLPISGLLRLIAAVGLLDVWTYGWHRICHEFPILWRFHRVHHSDAEMDVTSANRFHLVEIAVSSILRIGILPLMGIRFGELVVYETALQVLVQWQHANVRLPRLMESALRLFLVTPGLHQVHHSQLRVETDSNFSSLFSIWDRIGRTFRTRQDPSQIVLGLENVKDIRTLRPLLQKT